MTQPRISLSRLARALERYDSKYEAFEFFADDVEELHALKRGEVLAPDLKAHAHGRDLVFTIDGKRYRMSVSDRSGMARITRGAAEDGASDFTILGGIVGTAIGLAAGSKGEGWVPGLILGLLAGQFVDNERRERTVTVRYDKERQEWRAFGGPMSQWMREQRAS